MLITLPDPAVYQLLQETSLIPPGVRHFLPWYLQSTLIIFLDFIFGLACSQYSDRFIFPGPWKSAHVVP